MRVPNMAGEGGDVLQAKTTNGPSGEKSEGRKKLEKWLNKNMRIKMTDGRILIGVFVCTDKDRNVILGSCQEYLKHPDCSEKEEPRVLGLAMVPGRHIVTVEVDEEKLTPPPLL